MGGAPHTGLGSEMFISASSLASGTIMPPQGTAHTEEDVENDDGDNASTSSSVSSIVVALATATLTDSSWQFSPSYRPQYLSTISEYLPPPKQPPTMSTAGAAVDDGDTQKGHPWATEKYENSMRTDHVFDRFVERAAHEPQQCVRCALCLFCTEIDQLSDGATSIGTILAGFRCHLRQITYTSSYFRHR
jgi:pre-rRNA-processing protein TSR4